ncbi:hypothetical protein BP6252_04975 [Coleophoma cylindrospora]|uniref:Major facilitator superfamily (MFS) profile domain-containing protein n=1 Tax=Coleophoma cylindrospora TaxID=1849047 RepID=A0A3D8RS59_9HELO|nr:hypothetical protein BP6252_04975 [Coleophoma cylindrospora]
MLSDDAKPDAQMMEVVEETGHLANESDHQLTALQALKAHPWATVWATYAIWVIISASFEGQASGIILGIPEFRKDFGYLFGDQYLISAKWQVAFGAASVASAVAGNLGGGQVADMIGRKLAYLVAMVVAVVGITLEVIATQNAVFFAGKFVNGFALGAFIAVSFSYIGEIAPMALRGVLTSAAAVAFTIGPLIVALILNGVGAYTNRWAYRGIFVAQYGIVGIQAIFWPFMPESPWWLAGRGQETKAAASLKKLGYSAAEVEQRVASILLTLSEVRRETEGVTFFECFRKSNLRRTIISIAPLSITALSGVYFAAGYATYYFQLAGLSPSNSFKLQIGQQVCSLTGNVGSWFLIDRVGRRPLMIYGLLSVTILLILEGALAVVATPAALKGVCALILVYCFAFNLTIGAAGYTILTETSTSRLRVKTVGIGAALQNAIFLMWSFVIPYLFNPDKANLGAKISFIFAGLAILCLVYLWFYQPETTGRTYEELDELFTKRIPARKFKGTITDAELKGRQAQEIFAKAE